MVPVVHMKGDRHELCSVVRGLPALLLNDGGPVCVRLPQISFSVLLELFTNPQAVLKQQTPVDDLERIGIDRSRVTSRDGPSAKPSKLRFILRRIDIEGGFVLSRGKIIGHSVRSALKARVALDGFVIGEIGDWIVTLYADATLITFKRVLADAVEMKTARRTVNRRFFMLFIVLF
jgi:hypothetical protein